MIFVVIECLVDPALPKHMIKVIADGLNPIAFIERFEATGPFQELEIEPSGGLQKSGLEGKCRGCVQGGPFSCEGLCVVCHHKKSNGSFFNLGNIYY